MTAPFPSATSEKRLSAIRKVALFSALSEEDMAFVSGVAEPRQVTRGEAIFQEGDPGNGFYVVSKGQVKIYKLSPDGKEQILHFFSEGEPFGEVAVFTGKPFPAHAMSLSKGEVLFFPKNEFESLIHAHPSIALQMLGILSMRLRQFTAQIENLSLKSVPARVAGYLLYLSETQGRSDSVTLDTTKAQLASLMGTIPETLSRIFNRMAGAGLMVVNGREIDILDRTALADVAAFGLEGSA